MNTSDMTEWGNIKDIKASLGDIIKEELNVKNVVFEDDLSKFMNYTLKPDL